MESILVDFYNLELNTNGLKNDGWKTPKEDHPKIMEFFEKHVPEVLGDAYTIGTLEYFKRRTNHSWFDFNEDFYNDYRWVHRIIDAYLEGKTHDGTLAFLNSLLENVRVFTKVTSKKDGREYGGADVPKPLNYKEYFWGDRIGIIRRNTPLDPSKVRVNLGGLRFKLRNELIALLNGEIEVRKCEASDCGKLYIPTPRGRNQRFCSKTCYHRIRKRAERAKK